MAGASPRPSSGCGEDPPRRGLRHESRDPHPDRRLDLPTELSYDSLDPARVRATVSRLRARIQERFPERNLSQVAAELEQLVDQVAGEPERLHRRLHWLRVGCTVLTGVILVLTVVAIGLSVRDAVVAAGSFRAFEWLPVIESGINDVVFAALATFFLQALPRRIEREEILHTLHRLRSMAHIVDMHQLTKDPETVRAAWRPTSQSVQRGLSPAALGNYLDYCSELLSLISKTAALFAEHSTDATVLESISTIEALTNGMSRKIWQKISLLHLDPGSLRQTAP